MDKKEEDRKKAAGIFIPAGLFIGFAIGFLINNVAAGMFGGLGFGFLLFGIVATRK